MSRETIPHIWNEGVEHKRCSKCRVFLKLEAFSKNISNRDGLQFYCKTCSSQEQIIKGHHKKPKYKEYKRQYMKNSPVAKAYQEAYRKTDKRKETANNYNNLRWSFNWCREQNRIYEKNKYHTDLNYKLRKTLRTRVRKAIKNNQKAGSAIQDLGCSVPELIIHLESKFQVGITWDNYGFGRNKWNIDHVRPLASFDLTDRQQFLEANHYSNLQPLWHIDNMLKSNNYE